MRSQASPEQDASAILFFKGYYLRDGYVWWIENDDDDNFQEYKIGPAVSYLDAVKALSLRHWPTRPAWGEEVSV